MIKAIIFDFDGVIGNSEESRLSIFSKIFKSKGLLLPHDAFKKLTGRTTKVFLNSLKLKGLSEDIKSEIHEEYNKEFKGNFSFSF